MTKIAIITRTKDRPTFLRRALLSVAAQTFDDYVQVIVNDGGDTAAVQNAVDALPEAQRAKVRVFHREVASNAPDTIFNESIDRVDSEYFTIHDDDDTWHPEFLTQTVSVLDEKSDIAAVVVRADKVIERVDGENIHQIKSSPWMPDIKAVNLYRQCIDNQMTPIATLFRRSAYQEVGKFDDSLPVVGDWEFGLRLLMSYDVDFIDPGYPLAFYHHRTYKAGVEGNTSFASNDRHRYYTNKIMNKYLRDELREGHVGVGYIMSQLRYNQSNIAKLISRFLPSTIVNRLKRRAGN